MVVKTQQPGIEDRWWYHTSPEAEDWYKQERQEWDEILYEPEIGKAESHPGWDFGVIAEQMGEDAWQQAWMPVFSPVGSDQKKARDIWMDTEERGGTIQDWAANQQKLTGRIGMHLGISSDEIAQVTNVEEFENLVRSKNEPKWKRAEPVIGFGETRLTPEQAWESYQSGQFPEALVKQTFKGIENFETYEDYYASLKAAPSGGPQDFRMQYLQDLRKGDTFYKRPHWSNWEQKQDEFAYGTGKLEPGKEFTYETILPYVDNPEVRGRFRELKYRQMSMGYKAVSEDQLMQWAIQDVEALRGGKGKELIEFNSAKDRLSLEWTSDIPKEYQKYEAKKETEYEKYYEQPARPGTAEKKEWKAKLESGEVAIEDAPKNIQNWAKTETVDYSYRGAPISLFSQSWHDQKYLESLTPEVRGQVTTERKKQVQEVQDIEPEVWREQEKVWGWIDGGKVGTRPATALLLDYDVDRLEKIYKVEGADYLGRIKDLRERLPTGFVAESGGSKLTLDYIVRTASERVTTQAAERRLMAMNSDLFTNHLMDWEKSNFKGDYISYLKEIQPDTYEQLHPDFLAGIGNTFTKMTPEQYQDQLLRVYVEERAIQIAEEQGVAGDPFALDAIKMGIWAHSDAYDKASKYINAKGFLNTKDLTDRYGEDESKQIMEILGVQSVTADTPIDIEAEVERFAARQGVDKNDTFARDAIRQEVMSHYGIINYGVPEDTMPTWAEAVEKGVKWQPITESWWGKALETSSKVVDIIDVYKFSLKATTLLEKESKGAILTIPEIRFLDQAKEEMPTGFKYAQHTVGLELGRKDIDYEKIVSQWPSTKEVIKAYPEVAKETATPSNELRFLYHEATPWYEDLAMSLVNPIWYISGGGILKGTSIALKGIRAYRTARWVERVGVAVTKVENAPFKPITEAMARFQGKRQLAQFKKIFSVLDDETRAALEAIRAKEIAGKQLMPDEQFFADLFKGKWDDILATPKGVTKILEKADTPNLDTLHLMWKEPTVKATTTPSQAAWLTRLRFEEQIFDRMAGFNKVTAAAKKLFHDKFGKNAEFPPELHGEFYASIGPGMPEAGKQFADDVIRQAKAVLGKDIDRAFVSDYLHLRMSADILRAKGVRKLPGGIRNLGDVERMMGELANRLGKQRFERVEKAAKFFTDFYDNTLEDMVKAEVVSPEFAKALRKMYPYYNPTRYIEHLAQPVSKSGLPRKSLTVQRDIRRLGEIGIDGARESPWDTLPMTAMYRQRITNQNQAAKAVIKAAEYAPDFKWPVKRATASTPKAQRLSFYESGKRVTYEVPEWMAREATYLEGIPVNSYEAVMRAVLAPSRAGMTTFNLNFFVPNFSIDCFTALVTQGVLPHEIGIALYHQIKSIFRYDHWAAEMRRSGVGMMGFFGKRPVETLAEMTKQGQLIIRNRADWKRYLAAPFDTIATVGHALEMSPRLAVMRKVWGKGVLTESRRQSGILAARRVTVDFSRAGIAIRHANNFYLYLNAGVQGSLIPWRAMRDSVRARIYIAGYMGLTVANYGWNRQFPEYERVPNYVKYGSGIVMLPSEEYDQYGKVPHYIAFIPNLREFAFFSAPIIYALRHADGKAPETVTEFLKAVGPTLSPISQIIELGGSFAPQVPTPLGTSIQDVIRNYDSFRNRDIVPPDLINEPIDKQYNQWTSEFSRKLGPIFGLSPMKLDYLIENIMGGLGSQFLDIGDFIARKINPQVYDPRIEAIYEELKAIEKGPPGEIAMRRRDFLFALSKEDKEAVLQLERSPQERIPIISTLLNRVYKKYGNQVRDTARKKAEANLTEMLEGVLAPDPQFSETMNTLTSNLVSGNITTAEYEEHFFDALTLRAGGKQQEWRYALLEGAIAGADLADYLPEEWSLVEGFEALYGYWQERERLIQEHDGILNSETWAEIEKGLDNYLADFSDEAQAFVQRQDNSWLADLDPEARYIAECRISDYKKIEESGFWDMPPGNQVQFLLDEKNAWIDAYLVTWGDRSETSTAKAEVLVAGLIHEHGWDVSSVYGDGIDLRYKNFNWDIPIEEIYSEINLHKMAQEEGEGSDFLVDNPHRDATRCFMGQGYKTLVSYPCTEEAWGILEDLFALNNGSPGSRYGPLAAKHWEDIKIFSLLETPEEKYAFRRYGASDGFEEDWYLVAYPTATSIDKKKFYGTQSTKIMEIARKRGWR